MCLNDSCNCLVQLGDVYTTTILEWRGEKEMTKCLCNWPHSHKGANVGVNVKWKGVFVGEISLKNTLKNLDLFVNVNVLLYEN